MTFAYALTIHFTALTFFVNASHWVGVGADSVPLSDLLDSSKATVDIDAKVLVS